MSPLPSTSKNETDSLAIGAKSVAPITYMTNTVSTINSGPTKLTTSLGGPPLPSWVLDEREAARIARRRRILQERAVRIHQPRTTSIAVDVQGLSKQVEERRIQEEESRRRDEEYGTLALTQDKATLLLQQKEDKDREKTRKNLVNFWENEQKPERRREYDLNCHDHVTSSLYLLKFDGEDLGMKDRIKQQQTQTKAWLEQQKRQLLQQKEQEKEKERLLELEHRSHVEKARQLAKADEECKKALELAHTQYNSLLSREKQNAMMEERASDWKAEEQEIRNAVLGTFLNEDPDVARSAFGPHRVIVDRWKGMSPQQKKQIQHIQMKQIDEKKRRDEEERRRERNWSDQAMRVEKVGLLLAHKEDINRRDDEKDRLETNNQLARDQRLNQSRLNSILTTNIPTQEYYRHFGVYPR